MADESIEPRAILRALGVTDVVAVTPVHGGSDTAIWRVERADATCALRVFAEGDDDDCERERRVMQAASAAGLPVPAVYAMGKGLGRPALLLAWLPGWPIVNELWRRPWRAWTQGVLFGRMQADIHALSAPANLRARPNAWMTWHALDEPALRERLRAAQQRDDALLHLDYHPLNVLTDGRRITGVLDWRNTHAGDPRADAARTVSILRLGVEHPNMLVRAILRVFEAGWRSGYTRRGAPFDERAMAPYYAWAGAVMERDLATKRGPTDLARIHRWAAYWEARAGLADA